VEKSKVDAMRFVGQQRLGVSSLDGDVVIDVSNPYARDDRLDKGWEVPKPAAKPQTTSTGIGIGAGADMTSRPGASAGAGATSSSLASAFAPKQTGMTLAEADKRWKLSTRGLAGAPAFKGIPTIASPSVPIPGLATARPPATRPALPSVSAKPANTPGAEGGKKKTNPFAK
jgi:hypothetical protein